MIERYGNGNEIEAKIQGVREFLSFPKRKARPILDLIDITYYKKFEIGHI